MKKLITLFFVISLLPFYSCEKESEPSSSSSNQCAATTQKGTRCKRNAAEGSIYCWQHKK